MASFNGVNSLPKPFQGPWQGDSKIVIGIDIGTTQSGVAFAFLQKGANQIVHRVTRWPGQEAHNLKSKIPTIVWYDQDGKAVSFGAEALSHEARESAEDCGWTLAKHFKLHLHPTDMRAKDDFKLNPLPFGVSLRTIYTDFLRYLVKHIRVFFEERIVDGLRIWEQYQPQMEVVIAHPNGWGIREQSFLRLAAIDAGLTAESSPHKIQFVTEGEASAHFCIYHTNLGTRLQAGSKFIVCDAGGSTVDTTIYSVVTARPVLKVEEARGSACVQAGGIFVDAAAERYIQGALANASLDKEDIKEYTERGIEDFESISKRNFCNSNEDVMIEIAGPRFNNPSIRTRRGKMTIPGMSVKSFFDVCLSEIKLSVDQQMQGMNVPYILLAGGFGDSPFLRQELKTRYERQGCKVFLTTDSTSKAVADGALIWNVNCSVVGRAPRFSIGTSILRDYKSSSSDFQGRKIFTRASGEKMAEGGWCRIAHKGIALDVDAVVRRGFNRRYTTGNPELNDFSSTLYSYSGEGSPGWLWDKQGNLVGGFKEVCVLKGDLGRLGGALKRLAGAHGKAYWKLTFDICIQFGGTEWRAYLEWVEGGATHRGEVSIIPSDHV